MNTKRVIYSVSTGHGVTNKPWKVGRRRFASKAQAIAFAHGNANWRTAQPECNHGRLLNGECWAGVCAKGPPPSSDGSAKR